MSSFSLNLFGSSQNATLKNQNKRQNVNLNMVRADFAIVISLITFDKTGIPSSLSQDEW